MTRDQLAPRTPMRCPICDRGLEKVLVRDIGGVTGDLDWEIHAGHCPEHGWFQAEVISRPPREIFPVEKPFGVARRLEVDGEEIYSFPTAWSDLSVAEKRQRVNPFDPAYWAVSRRKDNSAAARPNR